MRTGVKPERDLTVTSDYCFWLYGEVLCLALVDDGVKLGITDDAAAFLQHAVYPGIGELTAPNCRHVVCALRLEGAEPTEKLDRDLLTDDNDAGLVRD